MGMRLVARRMPSIFGTKKPMPGGKPGNGQKSRGDGNGKFILQPGATIVKRIYEYGNFIP